MGDGKYRMSEMNGEPRLRELFSRGIYGIQPEISAEIWIRYVNYRFVGQIGNISSTKV